MIVSCQPKQTLDISRIAGLLPLFHSLNLGGIDSYSLSSENVTYEGDFFEPELALAERGV